MSKRKTAGAECSGLASIDLENLLDHLPSGVAFVQVLFRRQSAHDLLFVYANAAYEAILGQTGIAGRKLSELAPRLLAAHADDLARIGRAARGGGPDRFEIVAAELGKTLVVSLYSPSPDHVLAVTEDITELKRKKAELRESNDRFKEVLARSHAVVAKIDRELRYVWIFNPHPDFSLDDLLGKRDDEILDNPATRLLVQIKREVITSGKARRAEISFPLSEGVRTYDIIVEPVLDENGLVVGATSIGFDVTDQHRLRSEGAELLERIRELIDGTTRRDRDLPAAAQPNAGKSLSGRQREVLELIARGCTSAQIAERLQIKKGTVIAYRRELMAKLDLHSAAELTRYALKHRILTD